MNAKSAVKFSEATSWKALTYYNLYRFLIAFLFVSLYWIGQLPEPLGSYDRTNFAVSSHLYLLVSMAAVFFIKIRNPPFVYQVSGHVILDILLITSFIYSSAGLNSGFGMLLLIAIAGGSILIPGQVGFFFAAVATIAVLGHEAYLQLSPLRPSPNYTHAGFLGITFFITAFIGRALARRVEVSEALAEQRAVDLESLGKLNEHIVQRLQSGIIVLDEQLQVRLINESAKGLLGIKEGTLESIGLERISPVLAESVRNWRKGGGAGTFILKPGKVGIEIQASLVRLRLEHQTEVLVFLDDVSKLRQQAQQLKLASLGRLTASIAHEVRNPLGAISHAGQLLSESGTLQGEERRLITIINEQSVRVNTIIENVMRISRRERPSPSTINLHDWLEKFTGELKERYRLGKNDLKLDGIAKDVRAKIDPDQLYQVVWNICENGIRYSRGRPLLEIRCDTQWESGRPYIEIIDSGSGIAPDITEHLFEPFVTTETKGTGLGLFIARELCEANQATLDLYSNTGKGCCFRISFSHPEKRQAVA